MSAKPKSWRDVLPIHPAADMFPMLSDSELVELGNDLKATGQRYAIVLWKDQKHFEPVLIDGRNRLDALERVGLNVEVRPESSGGGPTVRISCDGYEIETAEVRGDQYRGSPYDLVTSLNIHRRQLTADQKRDLIEKLLAADAGKSDRQIAKQAKSNRNTVKRIRTKLEKSGDVSLSDTRKDSKGRQQPVRKSKPAPAPRDPDYQSLEEVLAEPVDYGPPQVPLDANHICREWRLASEEERTEFADLFFDDVAARRTKQPEAPLARAPDYPEMPEFLDRNKQPESNSPVQAGDTSS
jgi:hypothetical protein